MRLASRVACVAVLSVGSHLVVAFQRSPSPPVTQAPPTTMLFFFPFVASRGPETLRALDKVAQRCVWCGAPELTLVNAQQVTRIFFVPVHRGDVQTSLVCERCGLSNPRDFEPRGAHKRLPSTTPSPQRQELASSCAKCGQRIQDPTWAYCPACGDRLGEGSS